VFKGGGKRRSGERRGGKKLPVVSGRIKAFGEIPRAYGKLLVGGGGKECSSTIREEELKIRCPGRQAHRKKHLMGYQYVARPKEVDRGATPASQSQGSSVDGRERIVPAWRRGSISPGGSSPDEHFRINGWRAPYSLDGSGGAKGATTQSAGTLGRGLGRTLRSLNTNTFGGDLPERILSHQRKREAIVALVLCNGTANETVITYGKKKGASGDKEKPNNPL